MSVNLHIMTETAKFTTNHYLPKNFCRKKGLLNLVTLSVWKISPGWRVDRSEWSWRRDWTTVWSSVNTVGGLIVRVPTYFNDANPSMLKCWLANRRRISSSAPSDKQHAS